MCMCGGLYSQETNAAAGSLCISFQILCPPMSTTNCDPVFHNVCVSSSCNVHVGAKTSATVQQGNITKGGNLSKMMHY